MRGLRLESIDLAPADRAALKLGGGFAVTAQMAQGEDPPEVSMTREELLAELTAKDIPQTIREAIIQEHQAQNDQATQLAELRQERDDAQTLVTELQNVVAGYKAAEFEAGLDGQIAELINWNIQDETAKAKVDAFKRTVRGRILAELGTERDAEKLKAVVETVWEEMKPLAETIRDALAGPAAMVNGRPRNSRQIDDSPEARQKARSWVGI